VNRLSGYRYRDVTKRLKLFGFAFDRQAAGSHEIWYQRSGHRYTTIPNHSGDMPEGTPRAILRQAGISVDAFLAS
jgi:predicted RNA binding protein YcfA (HicA-like mRNA interferase family)